MKSNKANKAIGNLHYLHFTAGFNTIFFIFWLTPNQTIFYSRLAKNGTLEPGRNICNYNVKENRCEPEYIEYIKLIFRPMYFDLIEVC